MKELSLQAKVAVAELPWQMSQSNETPNGPGSSVEATKDVREHLPKIFEELNIKSMIDSACGDWNWMHKVDLSGVTYYGYDIMPEYIEDNEEQFKKDNIHFKVKDITTEEVEPNVDLIMCRDFLMHLKWDKVKNMILNFKKSGAKYLFATNFSNYDSHSDNYAIAVHPGDVGLNIEDYDGDPQWGWKPINLLLQPFNFPEPIYQFEETDGNCGGRSMCVWELEKIKL